MPRCILVGLDGSTHCAAAVEVGIQWALRSNAMLVGLGIIDEPTICQPTPVPLGATSFKVKRDEALLADATHSVRERVSVEGRIVNRLFDREQRAGHGLAWLAT